MALRRKDGKELPNDAIILSEEEALNYQFKTMSEWEDRSKVRMFTLGPAILGGLGSISGILINNHYRQRLRLGVYGFVSTYIPIVALPAIMSIVIHRGFIQPRILLQKDECFLCLQTRAMAMQCALGIAYPAILAPLASYTFAVRHYTIRIPAITEEPRAVFRQYLKMTRPITLGLTIGLIIHALVTGYVVLKETECFFHVQNTLLKEETRIDSLKEFDNSDNS